MKETDHSWNVPLIIKKTCVKQISLTFLVLCDDRVAEFDELSSSDLVDGLGSEVVLSVRDQVFDVPAQLVLSGHHVDVSPPASLTPLHMHKQTSFTL